MTVLTSNAVCAGNGNREQILPKFIELHSPKEHDFELSRGGLEGRCQAKWDERVGWGIRQGHQVEVGEQDGRVRQSGQGGGAWEDEGEGREEGGGQGSWAGSFQQPCFCKRQEWAPISKSF